MPEEHQIIPGQVEQAFNDQEQAAKDAAAQADAEAKAKAEAEEKAKADAETAEKAKQETAAKEEAEARAKAEAEAKEKEEKKITTKPRTVYDDLKERKAEAKAFKAIALNALRDLGVELSGKESLEDLQVLLQNRTDAETPAEKSEANDELAAFAQKQGMDPEILKELTGIILKSVPTQEAPQGLTADEMERWRADQAELKLSKENAAIDALAPTVREQLKVLGHEVHDEAEFTKVMSRVKELAHTEKFHDKELDYIVFANRAELSKLISPKKDSFEPGGQHGGEGGGTGVDYSQTPSPTQMAQEMTSTPAPSVEIRRGS